jgi:hypothetical protein
MTAHAITVLPVPGGATSTPQIASGQDLDGRLLRPGQLSRPGARARDRASTGLGGSFACHVVDDIIVPLLAGTTAPPVPRNEPEEQ